MSLKITVEMGYVFSVGQEIIHKRYYVLKFSQAFFFCHLSNSHVEVGFFLLIVKKCLINKITHAHV